jgi:hypothetical protein
LLPTQEGLGTGSYFCYCLANKASYLDIVTGDDVTEYTVPTKPAGLPTIDKLCEVYYSAMFWKFSITNLVSLAITVVNMAIRTLNIFLLKKVGYH